MRNISGVHKSHSPLPAVLLSCSTSPVKEDRGAWPRSLSGGSKARRVRPGLRFHAVLQVQVGAESTGRKICGEHGLGL